MSKCQKMITRRAPFPPRECLKPHYADGWCKSHHPDIQAGKLENERIELEAKRKMQRLYLTEVTARIKLIKSGQLTIDQAIMLLEENGYLVQKPDNGKRGE